jgi:hypothetical protein
LSTVFSLPFNTRILPQGTILQAHLEAVSQRGQKFVCDAGKNKLAMDRITTKDDQVDPASTEKTCDSQIREIARKYSDSTHPEMQPIFGSNESDSPLNPRGENFNARTWATNLASIAKANGQRFRQVGLCFQDLHVFGWGTPTDFQKDVGNIWLALPTMVRRLFASKVGQTRIDILHQFDGLIRPGEMCVVLGPPGSGCSTFLKTISGHTNGLHVNPSSYFNYQGISAKEMSSAHRGDYIYTAEVDVHFPMLTVGETLAFAARARCQQEVPLGMSRNE